jgi:hypothetical protein
MKYFPFMVFINYTPRLTINNNLNGLCNVFDAHASLEVMGDHMIFKM